MLKIRHATASALLSLIVGFTMSAFIFLSLREESFDIFAILFGLAVSAAMVFTYLLLRMVSIHIDRFLLVVTYILFAVGVIVQYRMDASSAYKQLLWYAIGCVVLFLCTGLIHYDAWIERG